MYEVYVGNLSAAISHQNLKDLFYKAGEIVSVWICPINHQRFTFAFVKFRYLVDAENACKTYDNANIDGLIIKVRISKKTKRQLAASHSNHLPG